LKKESFHIVGVFIVRVVAGFLVSFFLELTTVNAEKGARTALSRKVAGKCDL